MASLNDIAQRVKAAIEPDGVADDEFAFAVGQLLYPELEALARELGRSPSLRHHVLTDPAAVTVELDGEGVADLSEAVTDHGVLLDALRYGQVTHESSDYPLRLIAHGGQARFAGSLDALFLKCWLVGEKLHTRSSDGNATPLAGSLALALVRVPGLDQVSGRVEGMLVDRLAARMGRKAGGGKKDGDR